MKVLGKLSRWIDDDIALSLANRSLLRTVSPFRPVSKAIALLLLFIIPVALTADWLSWGEHKFLIAVLASVPMWALIIVYCVRLARAYDAK